MRPDKLNVAEFLAGYWQKQPLLIRDPWERWTNPLEPEELAGLSCEEAAESRLITDSGGRLLVEDGPIDEKRLGQLGRTPWTLLVQAVDHHVPAVAELVRHFRFVPNWRIDDVMVSYATDGGGVGAHFDQYDVFLIQGVGKRRWRVGQGCDASSPLLPHDDLRLLANFEATDEWILEPGDILYVPPGIAHEGTAVGDDCMTYSIGFRAPSRSELIEQWSEHILEELEEDDRYRDEELRPQENPGEITASTLDRLHRYTMEKMLDQDAFARWFGQFNSTPKYPEVDWSPERIIEPEEIRAQLKLRTPLIRNPAGRFSFIRSSDGILLFVNGECFECGSETMALAEQLCADDRIELNADLADADEPVELLRKLLAQGSLAFEEGEDA